MFEFVMLIGLLAAGLSQLLPDGEEEDSRPRRAGKSLPVRADRGRAF
ncbi:hypothetical protein [Desulfuromonas sp. DDH964]|nr:hypothetical protein [Desulfuromonas sp. DDH964]AMV71749.1 hypothetical protein DBW_1385 [Desulfuromonas sp. DDH964]